MLPVTYIIYDPPRVGLPYLVVKFSQGSEPIAKAFRSLAEAETAIRKASRRDLENGDDAD